MAGSQRPITDIAALLADWGVSQQDRLMSEPIRFRVRPVYHGSELLVEIMGDHREDGFPNVATILRETLDASQIPHPEGLDDRRVALAHDRYFSFWAYAGGNYEVDDDIWGLFVTSDANNDAVIADVERALISTGLFVKEFVDPEQFR